MTRTTVHKAPIWLREVYVKRRRQPKLFTESRILIMATTDSAGDGRLEKMEVDFSAAVDEKIPKCEQLTKVIRLSQKSIRF